jgi:hypothetical protein
VAQRTTSGPVSVRLVDYGPTGYQSLGYRLKKVLLGPPLPTARLAYERLRKLVALAVFSSDAISSTAYGTEQIMLVLVAAGAVATGIAFPIALAIGGLLAILILSYRQTITAYPSAGGAYVVTKDNFGPGLAQVAGSALPRPPRTCLICSVLSHQRSSRLPERAGSTRTGQRSACPIGTRRDLLTIC